MAAASSRPDKRSGKAASPSAPPDAPPDAVAAARQIEKIRRQKAGPGGAVVTGEANQGNRDPAGADPSTGGQKGAGAQNAADRIDILRKYRGRRERDVAIGGLISGISRRAERTHKKLGELIGLWEELVPAELAAMTRLTELRGSVLYVEVDSPAASYELDRLLRSGTEAELRQSFGGTLTGIRLRVGRPEKP